MSITLPNTPLLDLNREHLIIHFYDSLYKETESCISEFY